VVTELQSDNAFHENKRACHAINIIAVVDAQKLPFDLVFWSARVTELMFFCGKSKTAAQDLVYLDQIQSHMNSFLSRSLFYIKSSLKSTCGDLGETPVERTWHGPLLESFDCASVSYRAKITFQ
jgi:hypothetical protein